MVRKDLSAAQASIPRWVVDELSRTTSATKSAGAIEALAKASEAFQDGAFQRAARHATQAKEFAPRYAYIREVLGLATYRAGDWERGLAELRAYRRMSGDTTHLPVEMDILRALGRDRAVANAWEELQKRGGRASTMKEGLVVYASYLLDEGNAEEAWKLLGTQRVTAQSGEADRRVWYVAAKAAARLGDADAAANLRNAILEGDPGFPGIDELEAEIAAAGRRS
ncbi:MAG: hypothetical protein KJN71_01850 [Acidimicrobiia bacterium]|nr:hypothetical protein [Acidimicrobiia bacterium]NNC73901.1 hypothetical protein [Acidimicrobiia bacterium]